MKIKDVLFAIAILILTIFVSYYGINMFYPSPNYEDYCGLNYGGKVCPSVCVPLYEIIDGECVFMECGSGCGPDGINTFSDVNSCTEGLKISDQKRCEMQNGTFIRQDIQCIKAPCPQGYCDIYSRCNEEFQEVNKERSRIVFFIALPLGIAIVIFGAWFFGLEAVGAGLMGGGIGTLIYGSGAYWPYTENWVRFLLSLLGLVALIWFAYFLSKRQDKKKK